MTLFHVGGDGRRPTYGFVDRLQRETRGIATLRFFEYFHGDRGAGLGAPHQTGWTGLGVDIIRRRLDRVPIVAPPRT